MIIKGLIKRFNQRCLRRILRGHRLLKKSNLLWKINAVNEALTVAECSKKGFYSKIVFGVAVGKEELVVRQYLLTRLAGLRLGKALLYAHGKAGSSVVYPLPPEWRKVVEQHGYKVERLGSAMLWQLFVCAHLLYGVTKIGKIALTGITSRKSTDSKPKAHAYFADIGPGNLPQEINGCRSHDVISWYLQWPGKKIGIEAVHHSVANAWPTAVADIAVLPRRGPLPDLAGASAVISYALWGLRASLIAAIDCLRGRWWHALLLNQAALAAQVRTLPADSLAREYLFHNSSWIYRPLWTYEAELRGSTITFYFYSTNCESFKKSEGYSPLPYGWKAMTWPHYLVWDEYQADFVRRAVGEIANISVCGPIWFYSGTEEMPTFIGTGVAVFDITPHRSSKYQTLGADFEFYVPKTCIQFLHDIQHVTNAAGYMMLWKRKRKIGSIAHPHYRYFADRLSERGDVVLVDPDISALRVIESSCAVISMPFTSTALIARAMGKPSIYYDPTWQLQRDDRAAHGIPILSGPDELKAWLSSQINYIASRNVKHAI